MENVPTPTFELEMSGGALQRKTRKKQVECKPRKSRAKKKPNPNIVRLTGAQKLAEKRGDFRTQLRLTQKDRDLAQEAIEQANAAEAQLARDTSVLVADREAARYGDDRPIPSIHYAHPGPLHLPPKPPDPAPKPPPSPKPPPPSPPKKPAKPKAKRNYSKLKTAGKIAAGVATAATLALLGREAGRRARGRRRRRDSPPPEFLDGIGLSEDQMEGPEEYVYDRDGGGGGAGDAYNAFDDSSLGFRPVGSPRASTSFLDDNDDDDDGSAYGDADDDDDDVSFRLPSFGGLNWNPAASDPDPVQDEPDPVQARPDTPRPQRRSGRSRKAVKKYNPQTGDGFLGAVRGSGWNTGLSQQNNLGRYTSQVTGGRGFGSKLAKSYAGIAALSVGSLAAQAALASMYPKAKAGPSQQHLLWKGLSPSVGGHRHIDPYW